jgi:hypothetical protein
LDEVEAKNPLARNKLGLDGNAWRPSLDENRRRRPKKRMSKKIPQFF